MSQAQISQLLQQSQSQSQPQGAPGQGGLQQQQLLSKLLQLQLTQMMNL
jgi:hypothetical protein